MFNLSSYLDKFKNLKELVDDKTIVKNILLKETGIEILENNIKINNGKVLITGSSIQKNIIFLKKESLLNKIKEALPKYSIESIS